MKPTPALNSRLKQLQKPIEDDLRNNILRFWFRMRTPDGFICGLYNDLQEARDNPLSLVMVSRILWTYARAYRLTGEPAFASFAQDACRFLLEAFHDKANGGYAWWLSASGDVLDNKKQTYGQAFVVYAFAEYFMASGNDRILRSAWELFDQIEQHCWREDLGGYWEAMDGEWGALEDVRLSDKDMNAPLSMNTHLHVMEAYANLLLADRGERILSASRKVLGVVMNQILHPDGDRFGLFYDADWNLLSQTVSPGHDIEGSWLIWEMIALLGDDNIEQRARPMVLAMVNRVLETGVHPNGSIACEFEPGSGKSIETDWWPQAEGVVGFLNAFQMTGDAVYLDACEKTWSYIREFIIDRENGEWFAGRQVNGRPLEIEKAGPWKACYHNGRMGFEVIERIKSITMGY